MSAHAVSLSLANMDGEYARVVDTASLLKACDAAAA
jgi:hypothetical protein